MRWLRCRSGRSGRNPRNLQTATDLFGFRRISFSYYCESHMWGLTTGCMPPWAAGCWHCASTLQVWQKTANWSSQTCLKTVCLCLFVYHRFSLPVAKDSQLAEIQSCWCGTGSKVPVFHKTPLLLVLFGAPDCWNSVEARRQLKCVVRRPDTRGMSDSQKNAISCSGAACLCTLQNASRCMQYDLNNFKISRHNPSEVSWCCESMKASCTTTWSLFFSTSFYFSNLSNCNLFELHVHVPSARNRRQDWGGLARGDGSSCHISQCSDFAFLWGSAKVNVWTSIDFHSGNQVTRNVILGELVQVSIRQGFSRELQRLERFARAACAKDRRYQEVWSARGLATWKGTRFLDGTLLDFTHRNSKIARLQLHWQISMTLENIGEHWIVR